MSRSCSYCGAPLPPARAGVVTCEYCRHSTGISLPVGLPVPHVLRTVDHGERLLNVTVTVVGEDTDGLLRQIASRAPDLSEVRVVQWPNGSSGEAYLRLRLGDVRGFGLRVHLFAAPTHQQPWAHAFFAAHISHSDAVLANAPGPPTQEHWPPALIEWVRAGIAARPDELVALHGRGWHPTAWSQYLRTAPAYSGSDPIEALRALAKSRLRKLSSQ